jgi:hypothetical protein
MSEHQYMTSKAQHLADFRQMTQSERRIAYVELKMAEKSGNTLQANMAKYDYTL